MGVPCTSLYHGESGYSAFTRGLDHQGDMEKKVKTNAMVRHASLYHQGREEEVDFSMSVMSTHMDPHTKQLREGVMIISNQQDILLKSKQESCRGQCRALGCREGSGGENNSDSIVHNVLNVAEQLLFLK